jgi:hypothetical protein
LRGWRTEQSAQYSAAGLRTRYRALLANVDTGQTELPKENLDVGGPDIAGKYKGTDKAYPKLLGQLADNQFAGMPPELHRNILAYYKDWGAHRLHGWISNEPSILTITVFGEWHKISSSPATLSMLL